MSELTDYISANYNEIKDHLLKYCKHRGLEWSDDVFHSTLLRVLERGRLKDMTPEGILNYIFMSFKINSLRELQYPYVARRVLTDNPPDYSDSDDLEERIEMQALSDYEAQVILLAVELVFDSDHSTAFRLKMMAGLTYKQLEQKTGLQRTRQMVKSVREWIQTSVDREYIRSAFFNGVDSLECAKNIVYLQKSDNDYDGDLETS